MVSRRSQERGQDLLEFALTLPVLWLLLMGIFDLGRATIFTTVLYSAAREGARYGIVSPDDTAGIEGTVRNKAALLNLDPTAVSVALFDLDTNPADVEAVRVGVTYQFTAVTPIVAVLLGSSEVTLQTQATMRVEW